MAGTVPRGRGSHAHVLRYTADCNAAPGIAWRLLARPRSWSTWAPHLRGAWGLGRTEVVEGNVGAARLLGVVPVPARIVAKRDGRSWTWRVGGVVEMDHAVDPRPDGACVVRVDVRAPAPVEAALRVTYGPAIALLVRNLARVAERLAP